MGILVFALIFLFMHGSSAYAETSACFKEAPTMGAQVGSFFPEDAGDAKLSVSKTCREISNEDFYQTRPNVLSTSDLSLGQNLIAKQTKSFVKAFELSTAEIKADASLRSKFHRAYALVSEHFGALVDVHVGLGDLNMRRLDAKKALFLALTLERVRAKGDNFRLELIQGLRNPLDQESDSTWVRVSISLAGGLTQNFDLDPSMYGSDFVPLVKRRHGLPETVRTNLLSECNTLVRCLLLEKQKERGK